MTSDTSTTRGRTKITATAAKAAVAVLFCAAGFAHAGQAYWDTNDADPGAGGPAPNGTWGIDSFWTISPTGQASTSAWNPDDTAVFSAGDDATDAYVVTVANTQSAEGIVFENGLEVLLSSGQINLTGSAGVQVASASSAVIASKLGGSSGLNKSGFGVLLLSSSAPNVNTGMHAVTQGTLRLGAANQIADTAGVSVSSGATFDLNGIAETVGALSGDGLIVLGSGSLTTGSAGNFAGVISGAGGLVKNGSSTLVLGGTNTYSGATRLNNGTLSISHADNLGNGSATNTLLMTAGTLQVTASITTGRSITLASSNTFNVGAATDTLALNGAISGAGSIVKSGPGTLVLGASNSFGGTVQVVAGTLVVTHSAALGTTSQVAATSVANGATLAIGGGLTIGELISVAGAGVEAGGAIRKTGLGDSTLNGTINVASGSNARIDSDAGTLTLNANVSLGAAAGTSITYGGAGEIRINANPATAGAGGANKVYKDGSGTLTLAANSTHAGGTVISGGVLAFDIDSRLGVVPSTPVIDQIVIDGGTLRSATATVSPPALSSYELVNSNRGIGIGETATLDIASVHASSIVAVYGGTFRKVATLDAGAESQLVKTGPNELRYGGTTRAATSFTKLSVQQGLFRLGDVSPEHNTELGFGAAPDSPKPDAITLDSGGAVGANFHVTLHPNRGITLGTNGLGGVIDATGGTFSVPGAIRGGTLNVAGDYGVTLTGENFHSQTVIGSDGLTILGGIGPTTPGQLTIDHDAALGKIPSSPQPNNLRIGTDTAAGRLVVNENATIHQNRGISVGV